LRHVLYVFRLSCFRRWPHGALTLILGAETHRAV
jgi:hypothetical protein